MAEDDFGIARKELAETLFATFQMWEEEDLSPPFTLHDLPLFQLPPRAMIGLMSEVTRAALGRLERGLETRVDEVALVDRAIDFGPVDWSREQAQTLRPMITFLLGSVRELDAFGFQRLAEREDLDTLAVGYCLFVLTVALMVEIAEQNGVTPGRVLFDLACAFAGIEDSPK